MTITNTYVRHYPYGDLAAHILGYVGEISPAQLEVEQGLHARRQDRPRRDRGFLRQGPARAARPQPAARRLARAADQPRRGARTPSEPRLRGPAHARREAPARRPAGRRSTGSTSRRRDHQWYAKAGAIVALDPRDGAIRALASYPTFDPNVFTTRKKGARALLTNRTWPRRTTIPALDRAIAGVYPPGSTFKPVTALAAMQEHILQPYNALQCTGARQGRGPGLQQLGPVREPVDDAADRDRTVVRHVLLPSGQGVLRPAADRGQPLQRWAKTFGFGEPTGPRRRARRSRSRADDRLASQDVHQGDGPVLLAGRPALEAG